MNKKIYLAVLLAVVLSLALSLVAAATNTVDASININSYLFPGGRKTIQALNLNWSFFVDADNSLKFMTSEDEGVTWGNLTTIQTGIKTDYPGLSVYVGGSSIYHVHVTYCLNTSVLTTKYRRGTLAGNSTIAWEAEQAYDFVGVNPQVACDTDGYPWIGGGNAGAGGSYIQINKSSTNDGTWSTAGGYPLQLDYELRGGMPYYGSCIPIPLPGGRMVAVWQLGYTTSDSYICAARYTGASWDAAKVSTLKSFGGYQSVVNHDLDILIVALERTTNDIEYVKFNYSSNAFSDYVTLYSGATATSSPVMSVDNGGGLYVYWEDDPLDDHIYFMRRSAGSATWSSYSSIVTEVSGLPSPSSYLGVDCRLDNGLAGVYYIKAATTLEYHGFTVNGSPMGQALDAGNITDTSVTLRGEIIRDGNYTDYCTVYFHYGGGGQEGNVTHDGDVVTDEIIEETLTGLIPDNWYVYWMVVTNEYGDHWSNLIHFLTLPATETTIPQVQTRAATLITDGKALLNGHVTYDGGVNCVVGFQYRVSGSGVWLNGWNPTGGGYWNTDDYFSATLSNLLRSTTYEFRAQAKNVLGTGYGDVLRFTTLYSTLPTPTGGGIILPGLIPPGISDFFRNLSSGIKLILAIIINIVAVIAVAAWLGKSKGVGIATLSTGIGFVILFVSIGWYPMWIILLIGAVVGLLVFFILLGRK